MAASVLFGRGYSLLIRKCVPNDAHCNFILPPSAFDLLSGFIFSKESDFEITESLHFFFLLFRKTSLSSLCVVCSDFIFINFKTYNHFYMSSGTFSFVRDELYIDYRTQAS